MSLCVPYRSRPASYISTNVSLAPKSVMISQGFLKPSHPEVII